MSSRLGLLLARNGGDGLDLLHVPGIDERLEERAALLLHADEMDDHDNCDSVSRAVRQGVAWGTGGVGKGRRGEGVAWGRGRWAYGENTGGGVARVARGEPQR